MAAGDARARKISESRRRKFAEQGYLNSPDARRKMGEAAKGRITSDETRAKQSAAKKGRKPANHADALAAAHAKPRPIGAEHPSWKGDAVGYHGVHIWIRKTLGRPSCCERCGATEAKRYEWTNKSRQYRRDLTDWERLCASCHRKDGFAHGEYQPPVPKGGKTGRVPRSAYKKGERASIATEFKPGHRSHNAYLADRSCEQCGRDFRPLDATRKFCSRPCYWASMRKPSE